MTPTTEAGMSIWVYTPSQAKYRPIFSPKYFLQLGRSRTQTSLTSFYSSGQTCATSPPGSDGGHRFSRPRSRNSGGGPPSPGHQVWGCPLHFLSLPPPFRAPGKAGDFRLRHPGRAAAGSTASPVQPRTAVNSSWENQALHTGRVPGAQMSLG